MPLVAVAVVVNGETKSISGVDKSPPLSTAVQQPKWKKGGIDRRLPRCRQGKGETRLYKTYNLFALPPFPYDNEWMFVFT